jgi:hypothetical protein
MIPVNLGKLARNLKTTLFPRARKARKKDRNKKHHSAMTNVSQSLDDVLQRVAADQQHRVLVIGDKAFFAMVRERAPHLLLKWASCDVADVFDGAANPAGIDFLEQDVVICGGKDVAAGYRLALARMAVADSTRPVHWVAQEWEFCAGTFPIPAEADDAEAVLFNHFQHFFGIKDNLQFRIEIYCGGVTKHFYRILGANESLVLRLSDYFPVRSEAAAFAAFVSHPVLTRGRHYRLRLCGDVFWHDSLTTLHGLHEFNRSPDHKFEFRVSVPDMGGGDVILTLPNYARNLTDARVETTCDDRHVQMERNPDKLIEEVRSTAGDIAGKRYLGWNYAGYGGSNWYALTPQSGPNGHGIIAGNHHASVPVPTLPITPMPAEERAEIAKLRQSGFLLEPYALPVTRDSEMLRFGFSCDSANPAYQDFVLHMFDAQGNRIAEGHYCKSTAGPVFTDELPGVKENEAVALVVLTPDFERIGTRRKGFKTQFDLVAKHRASGDWDVTEGQTSWRNVGLVVPNTVHFAGPMGAVVGRTNLVARARAGRGFRTAVVAVHASGRMDYKSEAALTLTIFNNGGERREADVALSSFSWRCIWLDEIWPDLDTFLGSAGLGPLLATSYTADINCQIVTVSADGALSLQHMWGY